MDKANLFKHYAIYCVNHIGMDNKIANIKENNPRFEEFLEVLPFFPDVMRCSVLSAFSEDEVCSFA